MFPDAVFVGLLQPARTAIFIETTNDPAMTPQRMEEIATANTLYADRLARAASAVSSRVYLVEEADLFSRPESAIADLLEFLGEENILQSPQCSPAGCCG
jgi:hypothetical protein